MKIILTFAWLLLLFSASSLAQSKNIQSELFKNQKEYISNNIKVEERSKYLTLLHFSNVIRPRVFSEIKQQNLLFPDAPETLNSLERWIGYGTVEGIIWQGDSNFYCYSYSSGKSLAVQQKSYDELSDTSKTIIQNFSNWNHTIFSTNGLSLGSPTTHPFYLASKCLSGSVQTIGFYYQ
ncbi:MAG: hypothetical protein ABI675_02705 [Chitinophagaceae bacterium]